MSERWLMLGASSREGAERFAAREGIEPVAILTRSELSSPGRAWRKARRSGATRALVHSFDWERQDAPQFFELALAALPMRERMIVDDTGRREPLSGAALAALPLRVGGELATAGARLAVELRRFGRGTRRPRGAPSGASDPKAVLAIWIGESSKAGVGGSVTHISGVLSGFRAAGLRVGLVTTAPPPAQLARAVDDLEIAPPLPPGSRSISEIQRIADNPRVRAAGERLAARLRPDFVYQRHRPFLVAGADVAAAAGVPLVLEWNASEVWKRQNWEHRSRVDFVFDKLLARMEAEAVRAADLIVAVSARAAEMAVESGADAACVATVPNAVNVDEDLDFPAQQPRGGAAPLVGWIGTFGPWHGAEVLISALPRMRPETRLRMIGDGAARESCVRLAEELGVNDRIEWTGSLPHGEALAALHGCDVLASPHVPLADRPFFGSPMKIFEYMAIGRPIVASRLEQLDEVLEHGRTATLVTPGDVEELAEAVDALLALPDRGAALGEAAREDALRNHTWDRRAGEVLEALAAVGSERPLERVEG